MYAIDATFFSEKRYLARLRYSPVRVSTWSTSPTPTNGGTVIFRP
jgi:hypothetical protein